MKQTLTLFAALVLLAVGATAQKLSYSAVVRNSANELQANKTLTVGVSIANNATGNPAVYSETHSGVQTNQNGLLTLTIGEGTNVSGNLTQVTWSSAYITTTYTIDGSTVTNTVAVNAVPYALYAENSGTSTPVNDGTLTIKQGENTLGTFTANQAGQTNVNIPAAPTVNDGMLTIKQGENTLGTFSANQVGPTEVNIPAAPVVNNGTLTINMPDGTAKTFTANQSDPTEVTIPTYTLTAGDIINVINSMTAEEKAQMCAALAAIGCSGTGETPTTETCPTISVPSVTAGENNYILTATITLNGVAMDKISNVYFDIVDGANSGNNTRQWAATITPNGDGTATATANFPKQGENLTDMGTVEYNFYASTSLIMKSYCTVANDCGVVASEEYTYTTEVAPSTECPTFLSGETELEASDSKYIALISYTGGSGNETVSGSYTVANDETQLVLGQTLFIDRTSKQVRVEIAQSAVSLNAGEDLLVEITLTDGTCTQSTATGVYTEPAEGDNCPQWGDVTETSFLVLNNNTVQLNLYGHNLADVQQEAFEVMLNGTTEQTFTSMEIGDAGDYIIFTGNQIVGVDYADATYRITYTPSQNCEQSSGLEVEGSFAICPYFVEATSITAASAYEFVVSTPYAKSGDFIIENGGYKVYTTPNLSTLVATVQMTPATQIVVTADNDELIAIVDLTDLITPEALALLDGQTLYIQPFLMTMECGTVTGEVLQYIVQEPTPTTPVDGQPCPGAEMVTDNDPTPNTYATVQIGNQCWMAENLRSEYYADGTTEITGLYAPDNNAGNVATYGYLYNWAAVMHGASSSSTNPSTVQGICPTGWHVPSDAEWTQFTDYVSSRSEYVCGDDNDYIAKALASTTGWSTSVTDESYRCQPRYNPATTNNTSGFGALPAGHRDGVGSYGNFGYGASFWSTTENTSDGNAWSRNLHFTSPTVNGGNIDKSYALSVRCLKN